MILFGISRKAVLIPLGHAILPLHIEDEERPILRFKMINICGARTEAFPITILGASEGISRSYSSAKNRS